MTRHMLVRSVLVALGLFFVCVSDSDAAGFNHHGSLCQPKAGPANIVNVAYTQWGVHNQSPAGIPAFVVCGGVYEHLRPLNAVTVIVYDRHPSMDVVCSLAAVDSLGNTVYSDTQSSTGVQFPFQQLDFFPGGVVPTTIALDCEIPPHDASSGFFSHVTTYSTTTP